MVFISQTAAANHPRRGVVLLVVMALLALFAAIGLTFVYFADSEATASKHYVDALGNQGNGTLDIDPNQLLSFFLSQLIYGPDDNNKLSAMLGHELARGIYGYDPNNAASNTIPFAGSGRLHWNPKNPNPWNIDPFKMINYTQFPGDKYTPLLDPKEGGTSWTYPDYDNVLLAAINGNGEVLLPSGHRYWNGCSFTDLSPWQKYLTLRPHRSYHNQFPDPEDPGGDVRNLEYSKGTRNPNDPTKNFTNDSFWIDLGFPVMAGPNGLKYKPLFAMLMIDLDGKLNVNMAGNLRQQNGQHASNHGLGPWEINLTRVLNESDWFNLFQGINGQNRTQGRYSKANGTALPSLPGTIFPPIFSPGRFYSPYDLDGVDSTYTISKRLLLPGEAGNGNPLHFLFPNFPMGSYGSGDVFERTNHPMLYNFFSPQGSGNEQDRVIGANHMEALLRCCTATLTSSSSDLFKLCPQNFLTPVTNEVARRRRWVTTHSFGLGQPGMAAWLQYGDPAAAYTLAGGNPYPTGNDVPLPVAAWASNTGEFANNGRGFVLPFGSRLNLNRDLRPYPAPDNNGTIIDTAAFQQAQQDRQALAQDIFVCLRLLCTGARPTDPLPAQGSPEYDAVRWLAQLAVNIVDYRDGDDYFTPFPWDPNDQQNGWVFGVEMPRVVINEAYAEVINDPNDPGLAMMQATQDYKCNFWVELVNPFQDDTARLQRVGVGPGESSYRLTIATTPGAGSLFSDNHLGTPDANNTKLEVADFVPDNANQPPVDVNVILPLGANYAGPYAENKGFYLLGPKSDPQYNFPGTNANPPRATLRLKEQDIGPNRSAMTYTLPLGTTALNNLPQHNLFLRRLACPHLPLQQDPNNQFYNPYITVDYVENVKPFDAVEYDANGMNGNKSMVANRFCVGRKQPFAAAPLAAQQLTAPYTDCPQHTFFRHNGPDPNNINNGGNTLTLPFDWLVHLDRPLLNPIELLQVSAVKPYELTQKFSSGGGKHMHRAVNPTTGQLAWFDDAARLYRFLEYVDCGWRSAGVSQHGRIPGKINLNTVWDREIFQALVDHQPSLSSFAAGEVDAIFDKLFASRTKGTGGIPGPNDKPFRSLTTPFTGAAATDTGLNDTLLRPSDPNNPNSPRLFEVTPITVQGQGDANHPYLKMELLAKIANNVTTRSNVFAIWVTVGFFKVEDANAIPPKLGKEVGKEDGTNRRRRMFAIVDRSDLRIFTDNANQILSLGNNKYQVDMSTLTFKAANGKSWTIQPGMRLEVGGQGTVVESTAGNSCVVYSPYPPTSNQVICRGHPGPWPGYDHRKDGQVVIHSTIIE